MKKFKSRREKQICVLELLWAVLSSIVWAPELQGAYATLYEDNEAARGGLRRGMSQHWDINILLAVFWGGAAIRRSGFWMERVPSLDNPADCLTKPGLDRSHLIGAVDDTSRVDWQALFAAFESMLRARTLPEWASIVALFAHQGCDADRAFD